MHPSTCTTANSKLKSYTLIQRTGGHHTPEKQLVLARPTLSANTLKYGFWKWCCRACNSQQTPCQIIQSCTFLCSIRPNRHPCCCACSIQSVSVVTKHIQARSYVTHSTPFPCQLQCQQHESALQGVHLLACLLATHQQLQVTSSVCDMTALN